MTIEPTKCVLADPYVASNAISTAVAFVTVNETPEISDPLFKSTRI